MVTNLSLTDEEFVYNVGCDIDHYLKERHSNGILLFPPVNNYRRFLIHQTCENFRQQYDLLTFSVGQGFYRRTVVCFRNQLLNPVEFAESAAHKTIESRKRSPIRNWRTNNRIETESSSLNSTTAIIARRQDTKSSARMGVERNESRSHRTTHTIDLYRPPALRNLEANKNSVNATTTTTNPLVTKPTAVNCSPSSPSFSFPGTTTTKTTSESCKNSPKHANEQNNINFENTTNSVSSSNRNTPEGAATALTQSGATIPSVQENAQQQQQQQQQQPAVARRERRPDRAVYIPRARRSQTTPPTAAAAAANQVNNSNSSDHQQQLSITAEVETASSVSMPQSSKADEINGRSALKKFKSNKEHKERTRKSSTTNGTVQNNNHLKTKTTTTTKEDKELKSNEEIEAELNKITRLNCDNNAAQRIDEKQEQLLSRMNTTTTQRKMNRTNSIDSKTKDAVNQRSAVAHAQDHNMSKLRIEDVAAATNEHAQHTSKCDTETQELQRASKEINRSNRRIIKQTFVSNVLEIPDKAVSNNQENDYNHRLKLQTTPAIANNEAAARQSSIMDSTTEEEEEEEDDEDDWERMFDETGECLDPKILQELAASVGKVKIELPKKDYSIYLAKQSILNDEEFPHVLEVSNFPVEFKNQDLLMAFSQYKDTGFDIKWVDDTHALAVFSSSRIAAEVLAMGHPFVVVKPLAEATLESRLKAKKCAASLEPYRPRPATCAALARRLVTGALGVRLKTAAAERENEKRVLREAKERKLLAAKLRDEAWES